MKKYFLIILAITLGLMIMTACSSDSSQENSGDNDQVASEEEATQEIDQPEEEPFDAEAIKKKIKLTEVGSYTQEYLNATERGYATLAKNNSKQDIILECSITFYGGDGEPVATADSNKYYVNAGGTALLFADDEMEQFEKADVELKVEKPYYAVLSDQMDVKKTLRSDKAIITMKNKSKMEAEPAGVAVAFYNGDKLVDCQYVYCSDSDDPIEIGGSATEDVEWIGNSSVDSVKVYPSALSNGIKALPDSLEGDLCKEDFLVGGDAASYWRKNVYTNDSVSFVNTNDISETLEESGAFNWVYYTSGEDASEKGVITTARGIHLGDSKDAVIKAYGNGKEVYFNPEKDQFYSKFDENDEQSRANIKERAKKSVEYETKDGSYKIVFYFDSRDKVSLIFFVRS